jgi:hypothetical protein
VGDLTCITKIPQKLGKNSNTFSKFVVMKFNADSSQDSGYSSSLIVILSGHFCTGIIQGVSGGIDNILGGGNMDCSE